MTTAPELETVERTTGPEPTHSVIWLHGLGADGHDFEPIVPEFSPPGLPALRGLGLAGLELATPLKKLLAHRMMFGG